jgi:hypothetical protein
MVPVSLNPYVYACSDQDLGTSPDQILNAVDTQSLLNCPDDQENPSSTERVLGEPAAGASAVLIVSYWQEPAVPQVMITVTKDLSVGVLATSQLLQLFLLEPNLLPMDSHSSAAPNDHHNVLKNSSDRTAYHHADILYFETSFTKSNCTIRKNTCTSPTLTFNLKTKYYSIY